MGNSTNKVAYEIKLFFRALKGAFNLFKGSDPLRLAGATAFFANFALPIILILLVRIFGLFINPRTVGESLLSKLSNILDEGSIKQIKLTVTNIFMQPHTWYATALSFVFFLFVSTTLFAIIRNSLQDLWSLAVKPKPFWFNLRFRAESFLVILLAGLLFLVTVVVDSALTVFGNYIYAMFPKTLGMGTGTANFLLFIIVVSAWFTTIFRYGSIGKPAWKYAINAGILTAVLFWLGKNILRVVLPMSNVGNLYGAAGSVIIIMLFVFYSAMIFYFGACFVKALAAVHDDTISVRAAGYHYQRTEIA